eukprot:TRINITY_DN170_c0_g1_i1.p1 TRINITY_DN170_c0_g1~~TRINITY_DN170_c0_g1_i1.p1  ORF type:complete len:398 (-),score=68.08 TRINITY_DN170_c0_g1_i1:78-1271(-)
MSSRPDEPLTLKVMRLRRPLVEPPSVLLPSSGDGALGVAALSGDSAPKLKLPMSLSQSLVGEPFSGYLHLANRGSEPVYDIALRVEMLVGNSRVALFDNSGRPEACIQPGDFFDLGVEHELQDAGTYVLNCVVSYVCRAPVARQGHFKRSYRFPALQPFAVAHKVAQLGARVLVECSVENATSGNLLLSSWHFECVDGLRASPFPASSSTASSPSASGGQRPLLRPRGSHSIIFEVVPTNLDAIGESAAIKRLRELDVVGHLALRWHSPEGPSGCVEGHQVRLLPLGSPPLELRVLRRPEKVQVETVFKLEVELTNRTDQAVEPSILFEQRLLGSLRVQGAIKRTLPELLQPNEAKTLELEFLAAAPGLHAMRGLLLVDEIAQSKVEIGSLCEILAF